MNNCEKYKTLSEVGILLIYTLVLLAILTALKPQGFDPGNRTPEYIVEAAIGLSGVCMFIYNFAMLRNSHNKQVELEVNNSDI